MIKNHCSLFIAMALEIPVQANLRFFRCIRDSISAWASHIPIFFIASFLATVLSVLSGTLFLGSLYAGLAIMVLRAHQGEKPRLKDLFGQVIRFIRFFSMNIFVLLFFIIGFIVIAVPIFLSSEAFAVMLNAFRQEVAQDTPYLIAIGPEDVERFLKDKNIILNAIILASALLFLPGLIFYCQMLLHLSFSSRPGRAC